MKAKLKSPLLLTLLASCFLTSCIGIPGFGLFSSGTSNYTIGGTVINLTGTGGGLLLQDNGKDTLLVNANGTFTFPTALASGSNYSVTVSLQPSAPVQTCEVTHSTGTANANVTSVVVDCGHGEWTWEGGSTVVNQIGDYGILGTGAPGNVPGARGAAASWTDAAGNFWFFGGVAAGVGFPPGQYFNDLWRYSGGQWTWMSGSNLTNQKGTYGTQGTAAPGNIPGGRDAAVRWTDAAGNFWLFGGLGYDSAGNLGDLNDLWKYSGGLWTWMGGANTANQMGIYGTQGMAAPGNIPGARVGAVSWTDAVGNFWLFGGLGYDSAGNHGGLNDLWKYSGGQWTWMAGSNVINQAGIYGIQGIAAASNTPGERVAAVSWTDAAGNLWLFGGFTISVGGPPGQDLNDLWKYSAGQWTWMGGSNVLNQKGIYGTQGTPAPGNVPGARDSASTWTDAAGNFWLFGGAGYDSTGTNGTLNDLWKFSMTQGQWTWVGGSNTANQKGMYGTEATIAPGDTPGVRIGAAVWTDAAGDFWLFGGGGLDSVGNTGSLNDLWKYEP
jgi:hypothetical protein